MHCVALVAQANAPATAAADEYLRSGLLGATCVILAFVIVVLWKENRQMAREHAKAIADLHAARVSDAQGTTAQLLRANEQSVSALTSAANAMEAQREALGEVRAAFKDLSEDIRMGRPRR